MSAVRVLFLSTYTGLGGGETSLLNLFGALDRSRIEPVLACPQDGTLPTAARAVDVPVHVVPWRGATLWFVPGLWGHLPAAHRLAACVDRIDPAVVQTDFHALPFAAAACAPRKTPIVFACYGWWFAPRLWQRSLYRESSLQIVAISEAVRRGFLGEPPVIDPSRVLVVPLGVDTETTRPRPDERETIRQALGLDVAHPLVTLVGRFQHVKGQHVFLEMARSLLATEPDVRFAMAGENVFGGSAEEAYKSQIHRTINSDVALRRAVKILGWIPRSSDLLAASDVVVCSSLFESFGMVPVEAMASGVPVVSTNVGGPAETIVDGETGFLVPPNRPDLLRDRVALLLARADLRARMGEAGRARALALYSVRRYADNMTAIYTRAAARR
jgi:glycosyltransferase involved in cell wall biosynthesis